VRFYLSRNMTSTTTTLPLSMINIKINHETARASNQVYLNKNPDFQREYDAWDDKLKTRFVETMLLGRSMNPIWTILNPDPESEEILDGMHRITTATGFLNNDFKLVGKYFTRPDFNKYDGNYFKDLNANDRSKIRNYNFTFNHLDASYKTDTTKLKDMYEILNKSSKSLNDYEFNKVLYNDFYELLKKHKKTCNIIFRKKDKRGDIEMEIIDLLVLSDTMPNSWSSITDLRNRYLKSNLGETDESVKKFLKDNTKKITEILGFIDKIIIRLQELNIFSENKKIFNKCQISYKFLISRLIHKLNNISIFNRHINQIIQHYNKLIINDYLNEVHVRNAQFQRKLVELIDNIIDNEYNSNDPTNKRYFNKKDIDRKLLEQRNACNICKKTKLSYEGDHITPWSQGGKTSYDNLQVLCISCHKKKSTG